MKYYRLFIGSCRLEQAEIIGQIMKASQEFGFFQVINHGVSEGLMEETMNVIQDDNVTHSCHPVEDHIQSLPEKPTRCRDVISTYCVEAQKFLLRISDLICEGLGLIGYFEDELTKVQLFLDWECQNTMILIS
ncbi:unnamed protein product [Coffea canephora]|uniref:Non-haem dioxygenase N-terminal domain-containing protein n=1 Tax=Coffea canephora TaxID=49390 RepID=A0A068V1Z3_COFCA|nr:unnamed protein product [Coffea canephora]